MGSSPLHPIFLALQELLNSKGLKLKKGTLERFLGEVDLVAPWFVVSGNLTMASWEKLGKDLDFAWEQGPLAPGTVGLLLGRSSSALRGLIVHPGIIDP